MSDIIVITNIEQGLKYYPQTEKSVVHIKTMHNTYHIAYDIKEFENFLYYHFGKHTTPIEVSDKSFIILHSDYDSSLLRYPMSLDCIGSEVIYTHPKDTDADSLIHGEKYTVSHIDAGNSSSSVRLEGIPNFFNTVRFTELMSENDPYYVRRKLEKEVSYYNSNKHLIDLLDTMISDVKSPINRWRDDGDIIVKFLNEYKSKLNKGE